MKLAGLPLAIAIACCATHAAAAQAPGELRGRVTDARTAAPIADARIEAIGWSDVARSTADGAFVLRSLEPRAYTVTVRAFGYVQRDVAVEIANGRTTIADVSLEPAPAVLNAVSVSAPRDTQQTSAIVYGRSTIENSGRRDIGELLRTTPGVVITQAGGPGSATHISIRGSGANEVLVLIDGVPANSTMTGDADLSRISLETVERVTVRTGAQSSRYGGRALAGVVEIETRHAADETSLLLRTGAWGERDASASTSANQRDGGRRVSESITGSYRDVRGDFSYPLPALRGGGTARRLNSDVQSGELLGTFGIGNDTNSIRARGSWSDLSRGLAGSIVQPSMTGRETSARLTAGIDARHELRWLSWTANVDATRERATFVDTAPPFGVRFNDTATATAFTATSIATVSHGASSLSLGGEARGLDVVSTELASDAPHWQRLLGAFGSARASETLNDVLLGGDAGLRVDGTSLGGGVVVSPRVGVTASHGIVTTSFSVGSGFAPPTLADQFFHEGVLVRANPALRPERTTSDVEGRVAIHDAAIGPLVASATAAVYRSNINDMILWFPNFQFVWSPSNFDVHRSGWELSGQTIVPGLHSDIQGTLNTTDVTYVGPVLRGQVVYRPRVTGSVVAGVATPGGRFEISDRYVGERRTVAGSSLNTLDPYWLTDLRWTKPLPHGRWQFDLTAGLDNVFNRPAAMLVDYPFPGRTWTLSLRVRH
jgi:outer membrane cobalamin receptor